MATYAANLATTRNQIAERLVEVTAEKKPTYSIGDRSISWESYVSMLIGQLEELNKAIQQSGAPFSRRSRMRAT